MTYYRPLLLSLLAAALGGCTTNVESNPARTATEELLVSSAAERAAAQLAIDLPGNAKVFVDNGNFEGTDSKNAIAAIRSELLKKGMRLVDDRKKADVIVETRSGALSIDRSTFLIGIPSFNVPIPFSSTPLPFPQLALYADEDREGIAKFAITGYDAKKGSLVAAQDPQFGFSHLTKKTALIFITWTHNDVIPEGAEKKAGAALKAQQKSKLNIESPEPADGAAPGSSAATFPKL